MVLQLMVDYHACKWPSPLVNGEDPLAQHFDSLNEPALSNLDSILEMDEDETGERPPVITFSHFLPLQVNFFALVLLLTCKNFKACDQGCISCCSI